MMPGRVIREDVYYQCNMNWGSLDRARVYGFWAAWVVFAVLGGGYHSQAAVAEGTNIFGFDVLHQIHLELSAEEYAGLEAPKSEGILGWLEKLQVKRDSHHSGGNEFPWVHATVTVNGRVYTNVAVRYKGHFTYTATRELMKRSLKIDLEHYGEEARFGPLKKITLNAGILDPQRMREALAYSIYRDTGVPASRTAFAEVTLSVAGKYEKELLGVYTLIEEVAKPFLKERFGDGKGLLLKPEGARGMDYFGEEWGAYVPSMHPGRDATAEEGAWLVALARLIEKGSEAEFKERIGEYLDVEEFLRYLAATVVSVNLDSPLAMGQNFFMYLPAGTKKLMFLPWDLDLACAAWPIGGSAESQLELSLVQPHRTQHKMIERLLADKEIRGRYLKIIQGMMGWFTETELVKRVEVMEKLLKEPLEREVKAVKARGETGATRQARQIMASAPPLRVFAAKRPVSVLRQLKELGVE
jgi:spore coat protein H